MKPKTRIKPGKSAEQGGRNKMRTLTIRPLAKFGLLAGCLMFAGATFAVAQENSPRLAQVVALDECDPTTFNAALGPDFCKNIALAALGYATTLSDLFQKAGEGNPDRGWDFEPDAVKIKEGTTLSVVDQGGEPHTFTEVAKFGGGFIAGINHGEATVRECVGGFSNVAVAKTRILQASHVEITGLKKGKHLFECCIHPWMRVTVDVKSREEE